MNKNKADTEAGVRDKRDTEIEIDELETSIKQLSEEIKTLEDEIADLHLQVKHAGEDREKDHNEYRAISQNQRATMMTLQKAIKVLKAYYQEDFEEAETLLLARKTALMMKPEHERMKGRPEGFAHEGEYDKKQSGGDKVLSMLREAVSDTEKMNQETETDEAADQRNYEEFVVTSNESIEEKTKTKVSKEAEKADKEYKLNQANKKLAAVMSDLETLANTLDALHKSCDFVLDNFTARQAARQQEMDALRQAKDILSGSDFNPESKAFLQRK